MKNKVVITIFVLVLLFIVGCAKQEIKEISPEQPIILADNDTEQPANETVAPVVEEAPVEQPQNESAAEPLLEEEPVEEEQAPVVEEPVITDSCHAFAKANEKCEGKEGIICSSNAKIDTELKTIQLQLVNKGEEFQINGVSESVISGKCATNCGLAKATISFGDGFVDIGGQTVYADEPFEIQIDCSELGKYANEIFNIEYSISGVQKTAHIAVVASS
jgi:hypothetical protein